MIFCGDAFSKAWGQGFALRGEFLSGCPERNQRGTRARLRMSASRSYSPPLDPILRGPPMREAGNHRKGAGGHGIGFRSITAAAERPVTFGWCFSWLEARLLGWWGSSSAQRIGGRPSVPPLQNMGTIRSFRRGRSQTGPQAAKGRPTAENRPGALVRQRQARLWNRTNSNFPKTQGPVARREFRHSLRVCAPEMFCPPQGVTPVMGVLGGI